MAQWGGAVSRARSNGRVKVLLDDVLKEREAREAITAIGGRDLIDEEVEADDQAWPGTLRWERGKRGECTAAAAICGGRAVIIPVVPSHTHAAAVAGAIGKALGLGRFLAGRKRGARTWRARVAANAIDVSGWHRWSDRSHP